MPCPCRIYSEIYGNLSGSSREMGKFGKIPAWEFFVKSGFVEPYG